MRSRTAARLARPACALVLALLAGCGTRVIDLRDPPPVDPVPEPTTPTAAVQRLQWSWTHRDPAPYQDLFTADYRFVPSPMDTAGRGEWFRESELLCARNLFVTGTDQVRPATSIAFELDQVTIGPSPEPGHDPKWHRIISAYMAIGVRVPTGDYRVSGPVTFWLVRGDSARIPQELIDRGYLPDSTRWWVERWEDNAGRLAAFRAQPSRNWTISTLKNLYLGDSRPRQPEL